jgi:hypothetical protein
MMLQLVITQTLSARKFDILSDIFPSRIDAQTVM